jgi:serine/threonine-protein kinase
VVHRDFKLSNILVSRRQDTGRCWAKVIDFGLVKDVVEDRSELTAVGQILGSPMYMAPEQIRAEAIDQRADLYALGVVLYRILVCERPFVQRGTPGLLFAHLNSPPRSFAEVRPGLQLPGCVEWTVMRCLEKDADDRFASAIELRRALKACRIAIEEPTLSGLTIALRDGMTILPPELSDISSVGSLIATPGISIPALPAPAASSGTIATRLVFLLGALALLGLGLIGALAVAVLVLRSPDPEPAFVPIESKPVLIEPPPAAVDPVLEEPAAEVAPARKPVTAPRPNTRTPAVPASDPEAAPAPAVDELPPAPAEEAAEGEQWGEGAASDLVDPWSE